MTINSWVKWLGHNREEIMDIEVLKKKVSSFRTKGGHLKNVSDDLLMEILASWENWEGPSSAFYTALGTNYRKMASLLGRAKKLKQQGYMASEFQEIKVEAPMPISHEGYAVELVWDDGKIIRFGRVDLAIDFLKKAA